MKAQTTRRLKDLGVLVVSAAVAVVVVLTVAPLRRAVGTCLQKAGVMSVPPTPQPSEKAPTQATKRPAASTGAVHNTPLLPADRVSARRNIVVALHGALARGDLDQAAFLNSLLAQEAFQRAWRTEQAWRGARDPETGLVPKVAGVEKGFWNTKDVAGDLFPFLLMATQYLSTSDTPIWLETMARERAISGPMPRTILLRPARVADEDADTIIFGASEYAKDGLLAVSERFGRGPWFERLEEIMHALIEAAAVQTKAGAIASTGAEVNGEMLQVLCRLYSATRRDEYLEMAERIAEAYLFEVLPNNKGLPAKEWDFARERATINECRFRDHGNEVVAGLGELYLLEKALGRPQAARYREPLKALLDLALDVGRLDNGLWISRVDMATLKPVGNRVADTWGYVLNAYVMFDLAEGSRTYTAEIERTMRAVAALKSFGWEGDWQDGFADSIESMLYLLPWFDLAECHRWVDDEIEVMLSKQQPSGFVEGWYLDGNYIRTTLLYATYKTQGVLADPWREDVCLGAARDKASGELHLYVSAEQAWEGRLRFDVPRHRTIWKLSVNYPRLNSTPEWFVVEPGKTYRVINLDTGEEATHSAEALAAGLPVKLQGPAARLRLKVSAE